jgi:hypothetical protein
MRVAYFYYLENFRSDAFLKALAAESVQLFTYDFLALRSVFRTGSSQKQAHRQHLHTRLGQQLQQGRVHAKSCPALGLGSKGILAKLGFGLSVLLALLYAFLYALSLLFKKVDRVVFYNGHPLFLPALWVAQCKQVPVHVDLGDVLYLLEDRGSAGYHIELAFLRSSDSIVCVSRPFKRYLVEELGFQPGRVSVLSAALPADFASHFNTSVNQCLASELRARIGASPSDLVLGYSGGRWFRKVPGRGMMDVQGLDLLCEAVRRACEAGCPCHLVVIGTPAEDPQLKKITGGEFSSRFHFLGRYKPLDALHKQVLGGCDLLCIPSAGAQIYKLYDRFKMYEYAAAGKPCLVAEGAINRNVFGDTAIYFEDGSTEAMLGAVNQAYGRPHQPFIAELNQVVQSRYTWDARVASGSVMMALTGQRPVDLA